MIGKHHAARYVVRGVVIAAFLAAIAVPSAAAASSSRRALASDGCQNVGSTWITITDDQDRPYLEEVRGSACADTLECPSTTGAATDSPYPGWAFVTDDLGLPWLVPVGQTESAGNQACVLADGTLAATASAPAAAPPTAKKPVTKPVNTPAKKAAKKRLRAPIFRHAEMRRS